MNKEFVPYEQALALKELGFDEPCWAWWHIEDCDTRFCYSEQRSPIINSRETEIVGLPTFSQAFRWFREKYKINSGIIPHYDYFYFIIKDFGSGEEYYSDDHIELTYEEAELACLDKLIEICKTNKTNMKTQEEIEQLAFKNYGDGFLKASFIHGYTQCAEDMVEKYTEEDLENAFNSGRGYGVPDNVKDFNSFINSLNKQD